MKYAGPHSRMFAQVLMNVDWEALPATASKDILRTMYAADSVTMERMWRLVSDDHLYDTLVCINDSPYMFLLAMANWIWENAGFAPVEFPKDFSELNVLLLNRLEVFYG